MTIPLRCCLACAGLKITWNSFATACLHEQATRNRGHAECQTCKVGKAIKAGRRIAPPSGVTIITPLTEWGPTVIRQPKDFHPVCSWTQKRKSAYPLAKIAVGETFRAPAIEQKKVRAASYRVAATQCKKFISYIENNKIFVTRTE